MLHRIPEEAKIALTVEEKDSRYLLWNYVASSLEEQLDLIHWALWAKRKVWQKGS